MKKTIKISNLDCAHCADKMEKAIQRLDEVNSASVNFLAQKIIIDINDDIFDETMKKVARLCNDIEPDCEIQL